MALVRRRVRRGQHLVEALSRLVTDEDHVGQARGRRLQGRSGRALAVHDERDIVAMAVGAGRADQQVEGL